MTDSWQHKLWAGHIELRNKSGNGHCACMYIQTIMIMFEMWMMCVTYGIMSLCYLAIPFLAISRDLLVKVSRAIGIWGLSYSTVLTTHSNKLGAEEVVWGDWDWYPQGYWHWELLYISGNCLELFNVLSCLTYLLVTLIVNVLILHVDQFFTYTNLFS